MHCTVFFLILCSRTFFYKNKLKYFITHFLISTENSIQMNNPIALDFKNFGRVISGRDTELLEVDEDMHPIANMPLIPFFASPLNAAVAYSAFTDYKYIKDLINNSLGEIEGVRFVYREKFRRWKVEFGTTPMEEKVAPEMRHIVRRKMHCAMHTASKAYDMFPEKWDDDDISTFNIHEFRQPRLRWFRCEISIYYDVNRNSTFIDMNRLKGDGEGFYAIISDVFKAKIQNANENRLWNIRKNYLQFYEGLSVEPEYMRHIERYMLNEEICKELASFMG